MVIYADGCDLATMRAIAGQVEGFTTNPSLMKQAGISDYRRFAREVLAIAAGKPVSFEVLADDWAGMEGEAREIAGWGANVLVKIPVTNTRGESTAPLLARLTADGIAVNVTAILSFGQADRAGEALQRPGSVLSVFAGRIADTGRDPEPIVDAVVQTSRHRGTRVLWASAREAFNVRQAARCGADIITLSPELLAKVAAFGRDLEAYSLDTVRQFQRDAQGIEL